MLTTKELVMLRSLVIEEAKRMGFGDQYNSDDNKLTWPNKLRKLRVISNKLQEMAYPDDEF